MPPSPANLSLRSGREDLAAAGAAGESKLLVAAEACASAWRIVEVFSDVGRPFNLRIDWSAGASSGQYALVSVSRATRVCVNASHVRIQATNIHGAPNTVVAGISDAFTPTSNQWQIEQVGDQTEQEISIPPYATHLRMDCDDAAQIGSCSILLKNGQGTDLAEVLGDAQPDEGIPLGNAGTAYCTAPNSVRYRAVFKLSL